MLVLAISSVMTAVALPTVKISPILLTRVMIITLLYIAALSFNAMYMQAIAFDVSICSAFSQVTSVSQSIDTFIKTVTAVDHLIAGVPNLIVWCVAAINVATNVAPTCLNTVGCTYLLNLVTAITSKVMVLARKSFSLVSTYKITSSILVVLFLLLLTVYSSPKYLEATINVLTNEWILTLLSCVVCILLAFLLLATIFLLWLGLSVYYHLDHVLGQMYLVYHIKLAYILIRVALVFVWLFSDPSMLFLYYYEASITDFGLDVEPVSMLPWSFNLGVINIGQPLNVLSNLLLPHAYCDSPETIPYVNTPNLRRGVTSLNLMYNSLDNSTPLKEFIQRNCSHLLSELNGSTGLSHDMVNISHLNNLSSTVQMGHEFNSSNFRGLKGQAGVYVFFQEGADKVSQCGSCINFNSRMSTHYKEAASGEVLLPFYNEVVGKGSFSHFKVTPIFTSPNYIHSYIGEHGIPSLEVDYILKSFTQQEVRSVEQAVSTFSLPTHFNGHNIVISHTKWIPGYFSSWTGLEVTCTTVSGEVYKLPSVIKAADFLDVTTKTVKYHANCLSDSRVDSSKYGMVKITMNNIPYVNKPSDRTFVYDDLDLDTSMLVPNKVYLYDDGLNLLDFGPYDSVAAANESLGVSQGKRIYNYVNKDFLITAPNIGMLVYYVVNRISKNKPALVHDILNNIISSFPSMTSAVKSIPTTSSVASFVKNYVLRKKEFEFEGKRYLVSFAKESDFIQTKARVENDIRVSRLAEKAKGS